MKVVFCSTMHINLKKELNLSSESRAISGHKFQENLIYGFLQNDIDITIINVPRVKHYPQYKKSFIKKSQYEIEGKVCGLSVGSINLKWLNYISSGLCVFYEAWKIIKKNKNEDVVFVVFNTYLPQTPVLLLLRRLFPRIILCDIIGDLNGKYGLLSYDKGIHANAVHVLGRLSNKMAQKFDCYGFLASDMVKVINSENKPYVVMEGFYREDHLNKLLQQDEKEYSDNRKIVFYAGHLGKDYDIEHLLRAFYMIKSLDYYLVIAGYSADNEMLNYYLSIDERIRFLGFISPEEVEIWQHKATVLVSPRTSKHEYVKYSFPSKTLECLASGKPFIAHRLPCNPKEYDAFIQYPEDDSDKALADKIKEICSLSEYERSVIGEKAKRFILSEKTPKKQCKKILELLENTCKLKTLVRGEN